MTFFDKLYSWTPVLSNTFIEHKPVYWSPNSKGDEAVIAECVDGSYDPFDAECPNVQKRIHVKTNPVPEIQSVYLYSRKSGDFLWALGICLVKEEVAIVLAKANFSGIEFRPVNLFKDRKCTKPLSGYVELRVTGRVPVDLERSGVTIKYSCPHCGYTRYSSWEQQSGLHFTGDDNEWPDVFLPEQPVVAAIMIKPHFAQLIVDMKLGPFMLVRLEDMQTYPDPSERRTAKNSE
jgi:hypothetical protein